MSAFFQMLFFALLVRPLVFVMIGLNIRNRDRLPKNGPAVIIANHNSHLDTMVLMSLFPLSRLRLVHPVAAADYFLSNKILAWFALKIVGIIPLRRGRQKSDPLAPIEAALGKGSIVILFPEGTRGNPEQLSTFKNGIWHLGKRIPDIPVIPVFLHGLGKSLPKGEALFVPFFCDAFVGENISFHPERDMFMNEMDDAFGKLASQGDFSAWK